MKCIARVFCALVATGGSLAAAAAPLDVADAAAYRDAHRQLAQALQQQLAADGSSASVLDELARHGREMPLRELCESCDGTARALGADEVYQPSLWLYQPRGVQAGNARRGAALIAFPPAGDDKSWTRVEALDANGNWLTLDARQAPSVPVLVLRINGELSFQRQLELANAQLRHAGLQREMPPAPKAGTAVQGSGRWTTRLESIRLNDDEEPWVSGSAEVYAITAGVLPGNQPQVAIVDMPYLDNDGHTYYPRQVILDWNSYSYGVANVLLYEHDDNTNYQELVGVLIQAIGQGAALAGYAPATAIAEIAGRIVAAMPSGWFANDDDFVDAIYTVEKTVGETRYGAGGNALVTYIPYELPN